jgi:aspartyl-tRNA(Asn)/glutamyl-tRNA(Gln) amidotransferase subunit A
MQITPVDAIVDVDNVVETLIGGTMFDLDEITWMPAWQIRELIAKRDVSPVEVVDHFLARIEEYDPVLKAFAHLDPADARARARQAEKAVTDGDDLGPLLGIPVSVKGHIFVEGWPTFDMSTLRNIPAAPRSDVQVERLRAAGAIVVGANTLMGSGSRAELAPTDPQRMYNWDVEARNPWDTTRVPGWSSSGTASAVSARLVPIGLGSDGGGSTRLPSAYSGVFGIVATPGRIPWVHPGAPAIALTASTGPMCRDVVDGAIATQAMAGYDGRDMFSLPEEPDDYLAGIQAGVEGMRFAWSDDLGYASKYAMEESPRVIAAVRDAALRFTEIGALVEPTDEKWDDFHDGFMLLNRAFGSGGRGVGDPPTPEEYWASMEVRKRNVDRFDRLFRDHDVLLTPTAQLLARKVEDWNDCWTGDGSRFPHGTFAGMYTSHVMLFNWLAMPAFSVPCGFVDGLPVGLQIVGKPGREAKMFRIARAFQSAFGLDQRPPLP